MSANVLRYAITDRHLRPADECDPNSRLLRQACQLRDITDFLQIREKDLSAADLRTLASMLRDALPPGTTPRLLLNLGHPEDHARTLALAVDLRLDGLHLPADSSPGFFSGIRTAFAQAHLPSPILSVSAHTLAEVSAAAPAVDLILFGPVFGKTVSGREVTPALGLDALAAAVRAAAPTPVLALGGLNPANTPAALSTGAAGVAGIRLFL